MKLICEATVIDPQLEVLTEQDRTGKKWTTVRCPMIAANVVNANGRRYGKAMMEGVIARYISDKINNSTSLGQLGHPTSGPETNPERVSHLITEMKWSGDHVIGKARLLETEMGNIAKSILEATGRIGFSTRGVGSTKQVGNITEVNEDFRLIGIDAVIEPSGPGCYAQGICEGVEYAYNSRSGLYEVLDEELEVPAGNVPVVKSARTLALESSARFRGLFKNSDTLRHRKDQYVNTSGRRNICPTSAPVRQN